MAHTIERNGNEAVLTLTIPYKDVETGMKAAAERLAEQTDIPGFRPGKAPYDVVKKRVGEMKLMEAAAEELIRSAFLKAMLEEDLETVGQPFFDVEKMAPGNDLVVTAKIALYPHVKKIADYSNLSIEKKDVEPKDEDFKQAKTDLARMQTKEVRKKKGEELKQGDKAVVNLTMKRDGVVLEGGEGKAHGIYTGEGHYITGLVDKILGMKEGETREFTLPFPKGHYQKHLAGKDVDFTIEMQEIFSLEAPAWDDAFAKSLGLKSLDELETTLKKNIRMENEREEAVRQEKEMLDLLADKSTFEDIPDLLVNQEIERMIHELKHSITQRGMEFESYLKNIGKTLAELKLDFTETALKRVKVGILLKEISKKEKIQPTEKEIDTELDNLAARYEDEKVKKQIYEPQYREYVEHQLKNRKVIEFLKGKMVK